MLRICLILTVVAGLGALGISHLQLKPRIDTLTSDLATTTSDLETSRRNEQTARQEREKAIKAQKETEEALAETTKQREELAETAAQQRGRADRAEASLEKVTTERNEMMSELTAWKALGIPVDQVRQVRADLQKSQAEIEAMKAERVVFERKNRQLESELARYRGDDVEIKLDTKLYGKVLAVDPKYDFVVLDVGESQGLVPRVKLMVSRDGKLIGKVQVVRVESNRSIANVLQDWKQADVSAGDVVLY